MLTIVLLGLSLHCFDLNGEELGFVDFHYNRDGTIDLDTDNNKHHVPIDNIHDNVLYLESANPKAICFIPPENI